MRTGNFIDRARTLAAAIDQYQHGQDDVEGILFEKLVALLKESRVRIEKYNGYEWFGKDKKNNTER